ncbi:hypothetical protein SEUCBS140593_003989 [Sporothrix eucalyptigena]|uniref:Uncharacterized protein n=1 Tax=Sporothrix eucalyptigena TaxID=1812306 RepID=A0ABP0BJB6_9PEZI
MPDTQESSASAAGSNSNSHNNASSISPSGGDRLKAQGSGATGGALLQTAATATPSPQRPRHHFTRSLSELSSPLRLRRQSQSQSPAPSHSQSPSQSHTQNQSRRNGVRDNQDSRGVSTQTTGASTGPTANGNGATTSPSQSPRLYPLGKSRTVGGINSSLASAAVLTGNYSLPPHQGDPSPYASYGSSSSNRNSATSTTVSPNTSRRPSVHTGSKDINNPDEYRLQQSQTAQDSHHHHHHSHRHHHHSLSTSSSIGYMSGHSTTIAALAAAATAVAAASPTTPATSLPNTLQHAQTNTTGGFPGSEKDRSQDELLQQQQERQASTTSGGGIPIDPAAVRAAAAALEKMQREQSRNAARVLQSAVADLDSLSTATSQRLDAAYGSVLSRLSALQDTVLALRSLASAARATNRRFTTEAEAITHEIDQQVTQLEVQGHTANSNNKESGVVLTPADQQHRLEQLSERVHRGRQTIKDLADRVETARSRVERWERADRAWQERTRTRLKVLWVIVSSVVLVLVVLLAVMLRQPGGGATKGNAVDSASTSIVTADKPNYPPDFPEIVSMPSPSGKFHLSFPNGSARTASGGDGQTATVEAEDPLRRLFDEL